MVKRGLILPDFSSSSPQSSEQQYETKNLPNPNKYAQINPFSPTSLHVSTCSTATQKTISFRRFYGRRETAYNDKETTNRLFRFVTMWSKWTCFLPSFGLSVDGVQLLVTQSDDTGACCSSDGFGSNVYLLVAFSILQQLRIKMVLFKPHPPHLNSTMTLLKTQSC